ncbi:hypothetical protein M407DRAFT_241617 [Tulasnella calospora MUT 4182]|uniref:DUF7721 domain-containing protein n=1 Tax=Tulasnella calospora MUT 4182 TaxID=1051891 RepID=A0A0C3MDP7_9AGAM|nr:hypothetical protein M407DRAFT_241617 [Tulasnella calospora MUT 4182]
MGFLDIAKEGLQAYQASQEKQNSRPTSPAPASQGSNQDYNSQRPSGYGSGAAAEYYSEAANAGNQPYSGSQGGLSAGTGNDLYNSVDKEQAIQAASQHSGDEDSSIFASALNHLSSPSSTPSLDHRAVENAHDQAYRKGNASSLDASSMGSAAAMQAFKLFTSGGSSPASAASSGGNSQSKLLSLAMGEAAKLFNTSGGPSTGGKQDVVNSATKTAMKLLLQSKMGGSTGGSQGGLGSLLSMASKFM